MWNNRTKSPALMHDSKEASYAMKRRNRQANRLSLLTTAEGGGADELFEEEEEEEEEAFTATFLASESCARLSSA
jgi:hypothetical protein